MKLTIEKSVIAPAMARMKDIVPASVTIDILKCVRLRAEGGSLMIDGTDLDVWLSDTVDAHVEAEGAVCVEAARLADIVRSAPDGAQIKIELGEDGKLSVRFGRSRFRMAVMPAEDHPESKQQEWPVRFTISAAEFTWLLDRVTYAVSTEETRHYLNGAYLHVDDGALAAVATDGAQLAYASRDLPEGAAGLAGIDGTGASGVILHRLVMARLIRMLRGRDSVELDISISVSGFRVTFDRLVLVSRLVDGTYPDYKRVIPAAEGARLDIDAGDLSRAIGRIGIVATPDGKVAARVSLQMGQDTLVVSGAGTHEGVEEVDATWTGEDLKQIFQVKYLQNLLDVANDGNVTIWAPTGDEMAPIRVEDGEQGWHAVVVPMRG